MARRASPPHVQAHRRRFLDGRSLSLFVATAGDAERSRRSERSRRLERRCRPRDEADDWLPSESLSSELLEPRWESESESSDELSLLRRFSFFDLFFLSLLLLYFFFFLSFLLCFLLFLCFLSFLLLFFFLLLRFFFLLLWLSSDSSSESDTGFKPIADTASFDLFPCFRSSAICFIRCFCVNERVCVCVYNAADAV